MIKFTEKEKFYVVLGTGGTGSWLASFLSKTNQEVIFVDGDIVEGKNILRQNFTQSDINKNKAETIGEKYGFGYVSEFLSDVDMLKEIISSSDKVPVIVGCLDNNASRKIVHDLFESDIEDMIWLDAGNAERNGQIYIAVKEGSKVIYPSPLSVDDTFTNFEGDERRPDQISCAEQSESAPQNVTANVTSATYLFNLIQVVDKGGIALGNKISWSALTMISEVHEKISK